MLITGAISGRYYQNSLPTVGTIKSDIRYLIEKWDREYSAEIGFYLASRHLPYTKRFILAKAIEEFTKRYPGTNGLLLLEAMDELKQEIKELNI